MGGKNAIFRKNRPNDASAQKLSPFSNWKNPPAGGRSLYSACWGFDGRKMLVIMDAMPERTLAVGSTHIAIIAIDDG